MAKTKTVFFCKNCGSESSKWEGQCRQCGEWNTLVEEKVIKGTKAAEIRPDWRKDSGRGGPKPVVLPQVQAGEIRLSLIHI